MRAGWGRGAQAGRSLLILGRGGQLSRRKPLPPAAGGGPAGGRPGASREEIEPTTSEAWRKAQQLPPKPPVHENQVRTQRRLLGQTARHTHTYTRMHARTRAPPAAAGAIAHATQCTSRRAPTSPPRGQALPQLHPPECPHPLLTTHLPPQTQSIGGSKRAATTARGAPAPKRTGAPCTLPKGVQRPRNLLAPREGWRTTLRRRAANGFGKAGGNPG